MKPKYKGNQVTTAEQQIREGLQTLSQAVLLSIQQSKDLQCLK
jgi:hypothetical protein